MIGEENLFQMNSCNLIKIMVLKGNSLVPILHKKMVWLNLKNRKYIKIERNMLQKKKLSNTY